MDNQIENQQYIIDTDIVTIKDISFIVLTVFNLLFFIGLGIVEGIKFAVIFGFLFFEFVIYAIAINRYDKIKVNKDFINIRSPYRFQKRNRVIKTSDIEKVTLFIPIKNDKFFRITLKNNCEEDIAFHHHWKSDVFKKWISYFVNNKIDLYKDNGRFSSPTQLDLKQFNIELKNATQHAV